MDFVDFVDFVDLTAHLNVTNLGAPPLRTDGSVPSDNSDSGATVTLSATF